ncbi:MAG: GntR family transcriptional regulator [Alphaproteobacteria bacterium]|nr:GntR family transcriptional regulator [Alphaproteobacteria bacterium]
MIKATKPAQFVGPIYLQVRDMIRQQIEGSAWSPGTPLPSELDMARSFSVSVGTMRKALSMLVDEGLLRRQRGRGTFVEAPCEKLRRLPVGEVVAESGPRQRLRVEDCFSAVATLAERKSLRLVDGESVQIILRAAEDNEACAYCERIAIPQWLFTQLEEGPLTAPTLFELYGHRARTSVEWVNESIEMAIADQDTAETLGCRQGAPILRVDRTAFDENGVPVEYCVKHLDLRHAKYVVQVSAANRISSAKLSS